MSLNLDDPLHGLLVLAEGDVQRLVGIVVDPDVGLLLLEDANKFSFRFRITRMVDHFALVQALIILSGSLDSQTLSKRI